MYTHNYNYAVSICHLIRNDSINTGYVDPHDIKHTIATTINTFRLASHSVSLYMCNGRCYTMCLFIIIGDSLAWSTVSDRTYRMGSVLPTNYSQCTSSFCNKSSGIKSPARNVNSSLILLHIHNIIIIMTKDVNVNFDPEVVVIAAAGDNSTLIKDFTLKYSISSGDALTINGSLGTVTVDETFSRTIVGCPAIESFILSLLFFSPSEKTGQIYVVP